jgi:hypothetical protein
VTIFGIQHDRILQGRLSMSASTALPETLFGLFGA